MTLVQSAKHKITASTKFQNSELLTQYFEEHLSSNQIEYWCCNILVFNKESRLPNTRLRSFHMELLRLGLKINSSELLLDNTCCDDH